MNYRVKNVYGKTHSRRVDIEVVGSKSITARAMLIAAIGEGESTLYGAQFSNDCETFLNCLTELGIRCERSGNKLKIVGCGGKIPNDKALLYVGSAGTAARFLPAFLCFCRGEFTLDCSAQMKSRPIAPLIDALKRLGAQFSFLEKENCYPFIIKSDGCVGDAVKADITQSSQFLSALLISAVCAKKPMQIEVEGRHGREYIDMTVNVMRAFGACVEQRENGYMVSGGYAGKDYNIEPDASAAAYFYAINRILGTNVFVRGLNEDSLQGDAKFIKLLPDFDGGVIDMSAFSDQALTLAAIAPYFSQPTTIIGVEHIRGQECDRIRAIARNLTAMGVKCDERTDGVTIYPSPPRPAIIDTFGDHRVAMSFALTGLRADGIIIENAEVCSKTFTNYFEVLDGVIEQVVLN